MSLNINKVTFAGNLTRDPELKALPSGMSVVNFSIASNRSWKDKDGNKQDSTEYGNIVMFGKRAEAINNYFSKGQAIYIEGRLQTRSWDKDGVKMYRTEIIADEFQFVGKKVEREEAPQEVSIDDIEAGDDPADIAF